MIREVRAESVGELLERLTPAEPDAVVGRRRDTGVYHGSSDASWPLLTSLDRLGGVAPPHTKARVEAHILRNFARYARPFLTAAPANDWELLVTAQHHGVPTRLLDWSYSPLIAAHFATLRQEAECDRAVWRLDWQRMHRHFGLPNLALLVADLETRLGDGAPFTPWALFERRPEDRAFACMVEPPSIDGRIVSQAATFTLATDTSRSFDSFLQLHGLDDLLTRIVIPAGAVARVRDQLDLAGMDERRLFPDLAGVAAQLRRYYS